MEALAKRYPKGRVYVVWDNLNIHHGERWKKFTRRHGGRFEPAAELGIQSTRREAHESLRARAVRGVFAPDVRIAGQGDRELVRGDECQGQLRPRARQKSHTPRLPPSRSPCEAMPPCQ